MAPKPSNGVVTQRLQTAGMRALESQARLRRVAERLGEELAEVTSPHGIPTTDLGEEDSMVIAIDRVIASATKG